MTIRSKSGFLELLWAHTSVYEKLAMYFPADAFHIKHLSFKLLLSLYFVF